MSDYLSNLIARTASPAVAVCPHLPSFFEPAPATGETASWPEFERFVEQPPVTGPSQKLAPMPLSIPTHQSELHEPEQTVSEISPGKKTLRVSQEPERARPPTLIPTLSRATPPLREDEPSNSTRRRSDVIKSLVRNVIASGSHEVSAREETRPSQPVGALKPFVVPEPRQRELPTRSAVQAVVPTIRSLPPVPPTPKRKPEPSINVTIGRVEIRAAPPAQQRAKPKPATVLSLEDYLRQRAKGAA
jgi:hypothetical protein